MIKRSSEFPNPSAEGMAKVAPALWSVIIIVAVLLALRASFWAVGAGEATGLSGSEFWSSVTGVNLSSARGAGTGNVSSAPAVSSNCSGAVPQPHSTGDPNTLLVQPIGQALYPFVLVSASRASTTTFHILGLSSRAIQGLPDKAVYECVWHPGNGSHTGPVMKSGAKSSYGNTAFVKTAYHTLILTCEFGADVGVDGLGGSLYLNITTGKLVGEYISPVLVLQESAGQDVRAAMENPPPYKYAFCGAAIAGNVQVEVIKQWLIYHLYIFEGRKAHFFFYDIGGLGEEGRKVLDPFVKAGFVTVLYVADQTRFPSWYRGQVLLINECLHRTRFLAEWTVFQDFDEFLYAEPPHMPGELIDANANASVLTFGSWPISISDCRAEETEKEWPIQRMLWRRPQPECGKTSHAPSPYVCLAAGGRRKYMVKPRSEFYSSIHQTLGSSWKAAIHFNASIIRLEHFRGLLVRPTCTAERNKTTYFRPSWIQRESNIAQVIKRAEEYVSHLLTP